MSLNFEEPYLSINIDETFQLQPLIILYAYTMYLVTISNTFTSGITR